MAIKVASEGSSDMLSSASGSGTKSGTGRMLWLFSASIADQIILSGTNFIVAFVLIRSTSDRTYGLYVLVQSAVLLLTTAQNAWLSGPLALLIPRLPPEGRPGIVGAVKESQRRFLRRVAVPLLLLVLLGYLLRWSGAVVTSVIAVAVIAGWAALRREYMRSVLLIWSRPHSLFRADAAYAAVLLLGAGTAIMSGPSAAVVATAGIAIAGWVGAGVAHRALAADPGWSVSDDHSIWRDIRRIGLWSSIGAVIYWLFGQSYSYVLATRLDLKAVADVNAARLLLMPIFVLTIGMTSLLTPTAAAWYVQIGLSRLVRRMLLVALAIGVFDLAYFGVVWLNRNWIVTELLRKHIADQDRLLLLWASVALIGLLRDVLQCALFAMGRLKAMAWQTAVSAIVALSLMWGGMHWWREASVLIGQIAGEIVNLAGFIWLLRSSFVGLRKT